MVSENEQNLIQQFRQQYLTAKTSEEKAKLCEDYGIDIVRMQKVPIQYGKRVLGDNEKHWEYVNLEEYDPSRPIVFCLSGNGTINAAGANGFCKIAENYLRLMFGKKDPESFVDLVGVVYSSPGLMAKLKSKDDVGAEEYLEEFPDSILKKVGKIGEFSPEDAKHFVETVFMSRCMSGDSRLSLDECRKNMSQVSFFTFCYGADALNMIMSQLKTSLQENGFKEEEVLSIMGSMSHVSFARKNYTRDIPTTAFYAVEDGDIGQMPRLIRHMENNNQELCIRNAVSGKFAMGQELYPSRFGSNTTMDYLELAYKGFGSSEDGINEKDHFISYLGRNSEWDLATASPEKIDLISQMIAWSLSRAVEHSLDNQKSDTYIPQISTTEMRDELVSIYTSKTKTQEEGQTL